MPLILLYSRASITAISASLNETGLHLTVMQTSGQYTFPSKNAIFLFLSAPYPLLRLKLFS